MDSATVRNLLVRVMLAGLATGVLLYGVAFGGIAALAFRFALGRVGRISPRATALPLSGCAPSWTSER